MAAPPPEQQLVYDSTNELVVLRAALALDEGRRRALARSLSPDEFLVPQHPSIWRALRAAADQAVEPSPAFLRRCLRDEGLEPDEPYLAELEASAAVPANLQWHVETLRWDATRARVARGALPELSRALRDPKAGVERVSAAARAVVRAVEDGGGRRFVRRPEALASGYKSELQARAAVGNSWPTGYAAVDVSLVEGLMPRRTVLVSGLSGSGKSTFVANLVVELAKLGRRPLYGAWEMGAESTLDLLVASMTRLELARVVRGDLGSDELARAGRAVDWLARRVKLMDSPFHSDEARRRAGGERRGRPSNDEPLDLLEGYLAEAGCDVVVMDLWERCLVDLSYEGVTRALYRQQAMHERYNLCGVIVQQLTLKEVERRRDKRPTRDSIKGVGGYVEVADLILGVHRDAQFRRVPDDKLELICLKQRKGRAFWAVQLGWDAERALVVGPGEQVPYDPVLDQAPQFGGDVSTIRTGRGPRPRRPGDAEGG